MKIRGGARGIDTDRQLIPPAIASLQHDGFDFVVRYLSRAAFANHNDIRGIEAETIRRMGMALGFVQHCPPHPWLPNEIIARADAYSALRQLKACGVPFGKTVFFDLEAVDISADHAQLSNHVNVWSELIDAEGYQSGLYVSPESLLSPEELWRLVPTRYWSAYNLDLDQYPAHRGVCIHQHAHKPDRQWCDIDVVTLDYLGCLPSFWESDE